MAERKGSKKLGAGNEAELYAKAMKAKGTSSSKGLDARPLGRNIATRMDRAVGAAASAAVAPLFTFAGLAKNRIGIKDEEGLVARGRGAFKDAGKFAKAAIMGEPKGEKYGSSDGPGGSMGKYYFRGSDKDWEKKESKQAATKKMAKGGSTGGVQTSADTARKLATEMGGMKKGGKPKANGLSVMIAIGSPMKKPGKKMMDGGSTPMVKTSDLMSKGGMMKPVKKAQGGAGKVRKGMMTPEGNIIHAMNKIRGK
jgi:hypothetical protein